MWHVLLSLLATSSSTAHAITTRNELPHHVSPTTSLDPTLARPTSAETASFKSISNMSVLMVDTYPAASEIGAPGGQLSSHMSPIFELSLRVEISEGQPLSIVETSIVTVLDMCYWGYVLMVLMGISANLYAYRTIREWSTPYRRAYREGKIWRRSRRGRDAIVQDLSNFASSSPDIRSRRKSRAGTNGFEGSWISSRYSLLSGRNLWRYKYMDPEDWELDERDLSWRYKVGYARPRISQVASVLFRAAKFEVFRAANFLWGALDEAVGSGSAQECRSERSPASTPVTAPESDDTVVRASTPAAPRRRATSRKTVSAESSVVLASTPAAPRRRATSQ